MLKQMLSMTREEITYQLAALSYLITDARVSTNAKVLVNGSPKTGTTWMLRLISSLPGFTISSSYNFQGEIHRYYELLPGEVVHGHDKFTTELWEILHTNDIKVIHMMRDPRDQTVSRMFHILRDSGHKWHDWLNELNLDEALMACIEGRSGGLAGTAAMISFTQSWLREGNKSLCVRYENLITNPFEEFQRVLRYLGVDATPSLAKIIIERNRFERLSVGRRFWKLARRSGQEDTSSHFRKGVIGDWKIYFKKNHIQRYKELAGSALIELGYEKDSIW